MGLTEAAHEYCNTLQHPEMNLHRCRATLFLLSSELTGNMVRKSLLAGFEWEGRSLKRFKILFGS